MAARDSMIKQAVGKKQAARPEQLLTMMARAISD
jgi:hypothetical protein